MPSGLSGALDDPDGDSVCNLMEYAFGTSPMEMNTMPTGEISAGGIHFALAAGHPDLEYTIEQSDDLGTWTIVPTVVSAMDAQTIMVETGNVTPPAGGRAFYRLQVTQNQ